ncbi:host cell division inhibitor Icd-like protein [Musicola paradisiaca]|uniref:host cell division inhibitor Icd-like protein n=1 Tax=Musicola paradisiaca TaxID=69223 RepID=UPI001CF79409|nr:host cell division inhibitor Icd-like protein [Musicola paradisiaca]
MAGLQSTQTRPKFQYRFLALRRHSPNTAPRPLAVEAHSEAEARRYLEPDFYSGLCRSPASSGGAPCLITPLWSWKKLSTSAGRWRMPSSNWSSQKPKRS